MAKQEKSRGGPGDSDQVTDEASDEDNSVSDEEGDSANDEVSSEESGEAGEEDDEASSSEHEEDNEDEEIPEASDVITILIVKMSTSPVKIGNESMYDTT